MRWRDGQTHRKKSSEAENKRIDAQTNRQTLAVRETERNRQTRTLAERETERERNRHLPMQRKTDKEKQTH